MSRLLPLLLLMACGPKKPAVSASTSADVGIGTLMLALDGRKSAGPDTLVDRVADEVKRRNLTPQPVSAELGAVPTTATRLALLAGGSGGAAALVLVEALPRFSAQVNGRYRWTVDVTVSVAPKSDLNAAISDSFDVPVHLVYYHEKEAEALHEAGPVIARRVGTLLEDWIKASGQ